VGTLPAVITTATRYGGVLLGADGSRPFTPPLLTRKESSMPPFLRTLSAVVVLVGCGCSGSEKPYAHDGKPYDVLPYDKELAQFLSFKNCTPTDLTETDLEDIEIILNNAIEKYNKNPYGGKVILSNSLRQYFAVVNENGEKEVYVNCFPKHKGHGDFVFIKDGGSDYFQVKINLTQKTYYDFSVNGDV
jgi:hypothetical protein